MNKKSKNKIYMLFFAYIIIMIYLLFIQRIGGNSTGTYFEQIAQNYNFTPFETISLFIAVLKNSSSDGSLIAYSIINLVGNVVMFIPLGYFLPILFIRMRKFWSFFITELFIIVLIEGIQLVTLLGKCDIDDLLLNSVGASLGYIIYAIIKPTHIEDYDA